jgi:hypothetical protein
LRTELVRRPFKKLLQLIRKRAMLDFLIRIEEDDMGLEGPTILENEEAGPEEDSSTCKLEKESEANPKGKLPTDERKK